MIESARHLFDIPEDVHYFNCAYMSPLLKHAEQAGKTGVSAKTQPWQISQSDFFAHSDRAPHYLSAQHPDGLPEDLLSLLTNEQIYVSKRGDSIRISPHLYNNARDAAQLTAALAKVVVDR